MEFLSALKTNIRRRWLDLFFVVWRYIDALIFFASWENFTFPACIQKEDFQRPNPKIPKPTPRASNNHRKSFCLLHSLLCPIQTLLYNLAASNISTLSGKKHKIKTHLPFRCLFWSRRLTKVVRRTGTKKLHPQEFLVRTPTSAVIRSRIISSWKLIYICKKDHFESMIILFPRWDIYVLLQEGS